MTIDPIDDIERRRVFIKYWMEKSWESLASAVDDYRSQRYSTCVRSAYYACFYALSAVLFSDGKAFKKHSAVRGALHRDFVKTGRLDAEWGRFYDIIFDSRQRGDYQPLVEFEPEQVEHLVEKSGKFIEQMRILETIGCSGKDDIHKRTGL